MKQLNFTLLLGLLISMLGVDASAHDIAVENTDGKTIYYYWWTNNKTELAVSYQGNYEGAYSNEYEGNIVIPASVVYEGKTYPVTSIGGWAFYGCSSLTSVTIPNSVTSISNSAFADCSSLTSVTIPNSVTSISSGAFYKCSSLTSVTIPNSVTSIASSVFADCSSLTSVTIPNSVTSISSGAFSGCSNLTSATISNSVTSIAKNAFSGCISLTSVTIPNSVTSIGSRAFYDCSGLTNVTIPNSVTSIGSEAFSGCISLTNVIIPNSVTSIAEYAFKNCSGLTSVTIPNSVTSIGTEAFSGCSGLTSVTIPNSVTSIGSDAFQGCNGVLTMKSTSPATLGNVAALGKYTIVVPYATLSAYRIADAWSDVAARIISSNTKIDYEVIVSANSSWSALHAAIGEENLQNVVSLKVKGSINGYDIMVIRNKMDHLHFLDLTDANIVGNSYEYITGYHTEDNVLPTCGFQNLTKLCSVKLPKSIRSIGGSAFVGCTYLTEVEFQRGLEAIGGSAFRSCSSLKSLDFKEGLETIESDAFRDCTNLLEVDVKTGLKSIGNYAFTGCDKLRQISLKEGLETIESYAFWNSGLEEIVIPYGVTSIGKGAFYGNSKLKNISLPSTLKTIGTYTFSVCYSLESISMPTSLENIPSNAFSGCNSLTRVDIPSTITSIGNDAFSGCSKLADVYTYIVEPTPIQMNTFSNYKSATLHVPTTSYYNYWYDTEWSQFRAVEEFLASYEYFYINRDFTISDAQGIITGEDGKDPDADLNPGSGLIVETKESGKQKLNNLHVKLNSTAGASVIANNNLQTSKVYFDIEVAAGRWYFLSFPFNVKRADITAPGSYVFRYYDAEKRANGEMGWQNWTSDQLQKGQGYIFQCAKAGTLTLCVEGTATNWAAENRPLTLVPSPAENAQDASWNFLGNPQTCYFDIGKTGYTQPITIWNGTGYEAVRPGDDTYALKPFEAFFVQKPDGQATIDFPADGRYTKTQWTEKQQNTVMARRQDGVAVDRQIVNLTLSDGTNEDKTRVVFNESKQKDYEMDCDAPKFMSIEQVPQLYSLDYEQTRYAINERPMGEVGLGYVATRQGELTISAVRIDQPVLLRDTKLQITHDLTMGDYTFTTEAGTFDSRFVLTSDGSATGIGKLRELTGVSVMAEEGGISFIGAEGQTVSVYSTGGTLVAGNVGNGTVSLPKGAYIIKVGTLTSKVTVR